MDAIFKAHCLTRNGWKYFDLSPVKLWMGDSAICVKEGFESYKLNASYSYLSRICRVLNNFANYLIANSHDPTRDPKIFAYYLRRFREHIYMERNGKRISSVSDDWRAFCHLVKYFQLKKILPTCQIPYAIRNGNRLEDLQNFKKHNHLGPSFEEFNIMRSSNKEANNNILAYQGPLLYLSPFATDEEWLDAYYQDQRTVFDLIRKAAIDEVCQARDDFLSGRQLIKESDVQYIKRIYAKTGVLTDPKLEKPDTLPAHSKDAILYKQALQALQQNGIITLRQREVLETYLIEGCTQSMVGKKFNTSGSNARTIIRLARKNITKQGQNKTKNLLFKRIQELNKFHKSSTGQNISFFSPNHPEGLKNLLGWIDYQNGGILYSSHADDINGVRASSFQGVHWCFEYGGLDRIRRYLGLTPTIAVAMAVIIIGETGVNVETLRNLKLQTGGESYFLTLLENEEFARFRIPKTRKGSEIIKAIKVSKNSEVNGHECFRLATLMTAHFRKISGLSDFWLFKACQNKSPSSFLISNTAWKYAWRKFLERHPELHSLKERNPQLFKIRGTAGILEWFETGGCRKSASQKLGNSISVAVNNYIPKELQEAYYRRQIRRFQNLLILTATSGENYAYKALNMTSPKEVDDALRSVLADPSITDKRLLIRLQAKSNSAQEVTEKMITDRKRFAFIWSPHNIALVILFSDHIKNQKLKHPNFDWNTEIDGLIPKLWMDLANYLRSYAADTNDRGHKIIFKKAMKSMEILTQNTCFPEIIKEHYEKQEA